jgi:large subunit ribosomal protein L24
LNVKFKLKRGDQVIVTAGKDKGKKGRILHVDRKGARVVVETVNMVTKHMKANRQNQSGGIIKKEAPIHISNVMYLQKGEPTRIGYAIEKASDGTVTKTRIAKKTGEEID